MRHSVAVLICVLAVALVASSCLSEESVNDGAVKTAAELIKGDWVRYRDTPNGRFMTIKEHLGDRTILTTYDPKRNPIASHQSEYVVDESGDIPVFRYKNKVVLIGPNRGAKDPRENSYIFRVIADKFYEVHGMLPNDGKRPGMTSWQRLKVNPFPKPAA